MKNLVFKIAIKRDIPKYQQIVDAVNNAIAQKDLETGDLLPSVNFISNHNKLSRDTVVKAYRILKEQGIIDSVPGKGYYVARQTRKVLLVLDTFKAYKEVMYHSFINNLPENFITEVQFHHYNPIDFKTIIKNSIGKYYKYIVMPFENEIVFDALATISSEKLLLIDWNVYSKSHANFIYQDFGKAFFDALAGAKELFLKYKAIHFIYPNFTHHPNETICFFKKFCEAYDYNYKIINEIKNWKIEKNIAYISVSDRALGYFLEQCQELNFEPGKDVGFLSYNETPMKKFIYKGISVVSTDFKELGTKSAEFVTSNEPIQTYIPTKLTIRESL